VTHQGKRIFSKDDIVEIKDPRGRTHYWVGGGDLGWEDRRGSDFEAISRGRVSVTPIHLDLTNYTTMGRLRSMGRRVGRSLKP
jgi:5'-nucleotidase